MTIEHNTFDEIVDLIGIEATCTLCYRFGGQRVYVSRQSVDALFGGFLNDEQSHALSHYFKGSSLTVPLMRKYVAVWLRRTRGLSARQIAQQLHVTDRAVYKWLRHPPDFPRSATESYDAVGV